MSIASYAQNSQEVRTLCDRIKIHDTTAGDECLLLNSQKRFDPQAIRLANRVTNYDPRRGLEFLRATANVTIRQEVSDLCGSLMNIGNPTVQHTIDCMTLSLRHQSRPEVLRVARVFSSTSSSHVIEALNAGGNGIITPELGSICEVMASVEPASALECLRLLKDMVPSQAGLSRRCLGVLSSGSRLNDKGERSYLPQQAAMANDCLRKGVRAMGLGQARPAVASPSEGEDCPPEESGDQAGELTQTQSQIHELLRMRRPGTGQGIPPRREGEKAMGNGIRP